MATMAVMAMEECLLLDHQLFIDPIRRFNMGIIHLHLDHLLLCQVILVLVVEYAGIVEEMDRSLSFCLTRRPVQPVAVLAECSIRLFLLWWFYANNYHRNHDLYIIALERCIQN
jgi:hypothetical protein